MKTTLKLFIFVWLVKVSSGNSYDSECFVNYSLSFPSDPEVRAERIQVDILHTISINDDPDDFVSRRKVILNRGEIHTFTYKHPDTVYAQRMLTLYFDGSTVYGAMAKYVEVIFGGTVTYSDWSCLATESFFLNPFLYHLVSSNYFKLSCSRSFGFSAN